MKISKILVGLTITSLILYKTFSRKIGPCSPEIELLINGK